MMQIKYCIIILTIGLALGQPGQLSILQNIDFQVKENGLIIEFDFSSDISLGHASGWYAQTEWFYITILNTTIDTSIVPLIEISEFIKDIQFDQVGESIQLSIKLSVPPENHEFFQRSDKKQLFLSLRSSMPIISKADSTTKQEIQILASEITKPELSIPEQDNNIKLIGYFIGISFTVSGILQEDSKSSTNWELPTGIGIFLGTYVYDKYFDKQNIISIDKLEEEN